MKDHINPSLIIATYNWKEALELVLQSVLRQSLMPYEVIIADDGSKNDTKELIDAYRKKFPVPLVHVWHEDKGFRLSVIRNKSIKIAKGNYIIQIDGDTILHKDFVKDHVRFARKGYFISGSRVLLGKRLSEKILAEKTFRYNFLTRDVKNRHYQFRFPFLTGLLLNPTNDINRVIHSVRGCNMSFWKSDLLAVNGYNEDMTGWGREDSELSVRLINSGLTKINVKFSAIQYHIYHPENSKSNLNTNDNILEETIRQKKTYILNGINKLNAVPEIAMNKTPVTAIIPTKNEEENIADAIKSVQWADEILVIDSRSNDRTVELARKMGVRVIQRKFDDFSSQKNFAIEQAKHDWIFVLDADERVPAGLRNEILQVLDSEDKHTGYWIKRINFVGNHRIRFSGWQNDKCIRLFHRDFARYNGHYVHEEIKNKGKTGFLKNPLFHYTYKSFEQFENKLDFYAKLRAREWFEQGRKYRIWRQLFKSAYRFFKHYILHLGFLDGRLGWRLATHYSKAAWKRYAYLKQLEQNHGQ